MNAMCKRRHPHWPSWAGGDDFRRRAESALTHPATVAALGVLLLNDLLFKALWPQAWLTGKLSDLAWLVFALPLLAFLLSFAARGNLRAQRLAFFAAYVGLPILYAAFNTFEPVHDLIMRGISLAGGAAGSPRDATDSLVIPLAWAAALWVWRRRSAAAGAMRLRWAVLVAGVAALASVASSYPETLYGVSGVGVSEDGETVASVSRIPDSYTHRSPDGGMTWSSAGGWLWHSGLKGQTVSTPSGVYELDGPGVVLMREGGRPDQIAYSTEYLRQDGNMWVQRVATERLDNPREIASHPLAIAYDDRSGNIVLALGIQGVVVGTPDGKWTNVAVGQFEPTDFSFVGKTRQFLSDLEFWTASLALCVSMTALGLTASRFRLVDLLRAVTFLLLAGSAVVVPMGLALVLPSLAGSPTPVYWLIIGTFTPLTITGVAFFAFPPKRHVQTRIFLAISPVLLATVASGALVFLFGFSDDSPDSGFFEQLYVVVAVASWLLGIFSLAVYLLRMVRRWRMVVLSLVGMAALVFLAFMPWLHLGFDEVATKAASIGLCGIAAVVLAGYAARATSTEIATCANCGREAMAEDIYCINCGELLAGG